MKPTLCLCSLALGAALTGLPPAAVAVDSDAPDRHLPARGTALLSPVSPPPQAAGGILYVDNAQNPGSSPYTVPDAGDAYATVYDGYLGAGEIEHSTGTLTISSSLSLGEHVGASGRYTLSGTGTLNTYDEDVGSQGNGSFDQSGGTQTVSHVMRVGRYKGSSGSYTLEGTGALSVYNEIIGFSNAGTFTQNGGTNVVSLSLSLGFYQGVTGSFMLSGLAANVFVVGAREPSLPAKSE